MRKLCANYAQFPPKALFFQQQLQTKQLTRMPEQDGCPSFCSQVTRGFICHLSPVITSSSSSSVPTAVPLVLESGKEEEEETEREREREREAMAPNVEDDDPLAAFLGEVNELEKKAATAAAAADNNINNNQSDEKTKTKITPPVAKAKAKGKGTAASSASISAAPVRAAPISDALRMKSVMERDYQRQRDLELAREKASSSSFPPQNSKDHYGMNSRVKQISVGGQARQVVQRGQYSYQADRAAASGKMFVRELGGEKWVDPSLSEWPENDFRLFVGDLGHEVTDEMLCNAFNSYTSFNKAKVVREGRTQRSKGFGFVSFADGVDFAKALREMNGKYIGNRPCKLKKSEWKQRGTYASKSFGAKGGTTKRKFRKNKKHLNF